MILMSLDASTKSTGVAIYRDKELTHYQCITASSTNLYNRINKILQRIGQIIIEYGVTDVIMEQVIPQHSTATFKALMYLQAKFMFMINELAPDIKVNFIMPNSWRAKIGIHTGAGVKRDSLKIADIEFVKKTFSLEVNDDIADAICMGYSTFKQEEFSFFA